jgi:hypothetical protein
MCTAMETHKTRDKNKYIPNIWRTRSLYTPVIPTTLYLVK